MLTISHVSERFIYGYVNSYSNSNVYSYSLYLFNPITLKLKLAYTLNNCNEFYGITISNLNSDAMYCARGSNLFRILFNATTNYDEVNLFFESNIVDDSNILFRIKEISSGYYFMSIMCNRNDNGLNFYYEVMSFQMNFNFETNSCLSLNNLTSSNEFHLILLDKIQQITRKEFISFIN